MNGLDNLIFGLIIGMLASIIYSLRILFIEVRNLRSIMKTYINARYGYEGMRK